MKKTYTITIYIKNGKSSFLSTTVATASSEQDVIDFIAQKKKEFIKDNLKTKLLKNIEYNISYEETVIINL